MNRELMVAELERDEGVRLKPYNDSVGVLTIGIGRNLRDRGITREEAYHLLQNDLDEVEAQLADALPWWRTLDEVRQRVLCNMAFNLGIAKLLGFSLTLSRIERKEYEAASVSMLQSAWALQVGPRAKRLAEMMRTGEVTK
jgi:lysozyme